MPSWHAGQHGDDGFRYSGQQHGSVGGHHHHHHHHQLEPHYESSAGPTTTGNATDAGNHHHHHDDMEYSSGYGNHMSAALQQQHQRYGYEDTGLGRLSRAASVASSSYYNGGEDPPQRQTYRRSSLTHPYSSREDVNNNSNLLSLASSTNHHLHSRSSYHSSSRAESGSAGRSLLSSSEHLHQHNHHSYGSNGGGAGRSEMHSFHDIGSRASETMHSSGAISSRSAETLNQLHQRASAAYQRRESIKLYGNNSHGQGAVGGHQDLHSQRSPPRQMRESIKHHYGYGQHEPSTPLKLQQQPPAGRRESIKLGYGSLPGMCTAPSPGPVTTLGPSAVKKTTNSADLSIEIVPGVSMRLRGAEETLKAIEQDFILPCECFTCTETIFCIQDADYVLCPTCRVVNPMNCLENLPNKAGGVGLGLTFSDLGRRQDDIVQGHRRREREAKKACM